MTTKVTITCHAYPVLVEGLQVSNNNPNGRWSVMGTVQPSEQRDFTLHSGIQFKLTELPQFAEEDK